MAIAILHVVGALVSSFAFGVLVLALGSWEEKRVQKGRTQDASIALGVSVAALDSKELIPKVLQYSSTRYSGELLRNRVSDLCGLVRTGWGWFGNLLQIGAILAVGWQMYEGGSENAIYMWSILPLALCFWLMSIAFSYGCLLLTGRYPGEAKIARKSLAAFIARNELEASGRQSNPLVVE